jgi:KDO2-lipid IV(A) lauroyltransferase
MKLSHLMQGLLLKWFYATFRSMPLDIASATGGVLGRAIGPFLGAHQVAKKNLAMAYPGMDNAERHRLLLAMWDNLGRTATELSHLTGDLPKRVQVIGAENLPKPEEPVIFFSAHIANWELTYTMPHRAGVPLALVYRHANNPLAEQFITSLRGHFCKAQLAKGPRGGMGLVKALKQRLSIAMLIDQKMNDGIAVPFFGKPAMTAPAIAELALRFNLPLVPVRAVRTRGAYFTCTLYPPLAIHKTGDRAADVLAIMTAINQMMEGWIREHPEQWFWVHRRWPKEAWGLS